MEQVRMHKPVLFLDRDGILVVEDQVDSFDKIEWIPGVFNALRKLREESNYYFAMVSNQDGVGTPSFPSEAFWPVHERIIETLAGERITFDAQHIDLSLPEDNCPGRKPGIGMLDEYFNGNYDIEHSLMIGDRLTDVQLAKNIGCKAIWFADPSRTEELKQGMAGEMGLSEVCVLVSESWQEIAAFILGGKSVKLERRVRVNRKTAETDISLDLNLDGSGKGCIATGIPFFDHMLAQLVRHSGIDADLHADGDLQIDEHHTVEDIGIVLGQAFLQALGDKRGISRYGFEILPMDDVLAQVAIDFSGRPYFVWDVEFSRQTVGTFPTEMFQHFFKSFCDEARCNLNMQVSSGNTHHQAEALFKAFARAVRQAVRRYPWSNALPSTKGVL